MDLTRPLQEKTNPGSNNTFVLPATLTAFRSSRGLFDAVKMIEELHKAGTHTVGEGSVDPQPWAASRRDHSIAIWLEVSIYLHLHFLALSASDTHASPVRLRSTYWCSAARPRP